MRQKCVHVTIHNPVKEGKNVSKIRWKIIFTVL